MKLLITSNTSRRRCRHSASDVVGGTGTTNDGGGGATSPVKAKIVVGDLRTRRGWGGNRGSINTDECYRQFERPVVSL